MNSKIRIGSVCLCVVVGDAEMPIIGTGLIANVLTGVVALAGRVCVAVIISHVWINFKFSNWTSF